MSPPTPRLFMENQLRRCGGEVRIAGGTLLSPANHQYHQCVAQGANGSANVWKSGKLNGEN